MLTVVVHNIYSAVKLGEVMNVVFSFPEVDLFVISKASSSAAQSGVPEVEKKAFSLKKRVLYVPDIFDVVDLLRPDDHYMIVPRRLSKDGMDFTYVRSSLDKGKSIVISVSGGDTAFSLKELESGYPVDIGFDDNLPPSASLAIVLYNLFPKLEKV